jgi:hypothetical protein
MVWNFKKTQFANAAIGLKQAPRDFHLTGTGIREREFERDISIQIPTAPVG